MFEKLLEMIMIEQEIVEKTKHMDIAMFGTVYAMIAEEWCKENKYDVIEFLEMILDSAKGINEALGKL